MGREPKKHEALDEGFDDVLTAIAVEQKPDHTTFPVRPFLKWVGGKRSILPELLKRLPDAYDVYHEPFLGGGALFFAIRPHEGYLSDVNFHLIITFKAVQNNVERLIEYLKLHSENHNKAYYLKARTHLFTETDPTKIAAWFIYLNKTCFNGLYRVNASGGFNVPMGDYKNPAILDADNLRNASKVLKGTEIEQHDFTHVPIYKNDFYYLDPPYHETYEGYSSSGFGDVEHTALAQFCRKVDAKGGYFMLSNSDTPFVRKLYEGYNIEQVEASRTISCKANQRGKENELIIRNYGYSDKR